MRRNGYIGGHWMFGDRSGSNQKRFYLLPGQGGSAYRRKQRWLLAWAIVAALILSAVLAAIFYWMDSSF